MVTNSITLDTEQLLKKATLKIHIQYPWKHRVRIFLASYILKLGVWIAGFNSAIIIEVKEDE